MAPSVFSQNSLAWSALPLAVFISYLWLKRKRVDFLSDVDLSEPQVSQTKAKDLEELPETQPLLITPRKSSRSLSGVESAPIDISYPPELRLTNSNEYVPDEDLDTELKRASSTNIFDRYQAVNQSVTSEQKDSAFYKPNQISDQLDQIPIVEHQVLVQSPTLQDINLEENILEQSKTSAQNDSMTQFDTSNHSEASQPEQGDILSQSFQNGMIAHEDSHLSNESSTRIESADKLNLSTYAVQLNEASQTAEIPEEVVQTAEIPEEVAQTADVPETEVSPTVEVSEEATTPAAADDEVYTPEENLQEVSSTVEEASAIVETSVTVSSTAETPEEVSSTVNISEKTPTESEEQSIPNDVELKKEVVPTQPSNNNIPNKTGAIPKTTGKKKKQKYRPLPLETITGGKTQSYNRNKRRNERRQNYAQSDEFVEEVLRKTCERANANSPTSASSSSISSIAESTDSGKGCSEVASPPASRLSPTNESKTEIITYSFTIPHKFVGLLKGAQCGHINMIKRNAHVDIDLMITNPRSTNLARKQQVCTIRGTKKEIDHALSIIKERFPRQRYPEITFSPVECPRTYIRPYKLPVQHTYVQLACGVSNDTVVACMEAPDHLYMHLHLSPSHNELSFYTSYMKELYSIPKKDQLLPKEVPVGSGCVALIYNSWYRAQILSIDMESNTSIIKLLDYGGIEVIDNDCLRQYHYTLMGLPFQAVECYLFNVRPRGGTWCTAAFDCIKELTTAVVAATHVIKYRGHIPEVTVYVPNGICINDELVRRNLADYVEIETISNENNDDVENVQLVERADQPAMCLV